jgi:hypothetical protein
VDKALGTAAVDEAFKAQVVVLFAVLCRAIAVDKNEAAHGAFRAGLAIAVQAHTEATVAINGLT